MHPLLRLKAMLGQKSGQTSGVVVSVTADVVSVRTASGIIQARNTSATEYIKDDEVAVKDGLVLGKLRREADIPVYLV